MQTVKMVVTGPFSAGKTQFIQSVSEIDVVATERKISSDEERSVKSATTVAMDFGRITVDQDLVLYLFGTPGQDRFGFMWNDLIQGALGAVVLVDSRRIEDSFPALDYFESRSVPFVVAVNRFGGQMFHTVDEIREALSISIHVPVVSTDARGRVAVKETVLSLLDVVLQRALARAKSN